MIMAFPLAAQAAETYIKDQTVTSDVYGGQSTNANASGNVIVIEGDSTEVKRASGNNAFIIGGYANNSSGGAGNATDNTVTISGGQFPGSSSNNNYIIGGRVSAGTGNAADNTITISGGSFTNKNTYIYGGNVYAPQNGTATGDATGNKIIIKGDAVFEGTGNTDIIGGVVSKYDSNNYNNTVTGNATGNTVYIEGGVFNANTTIIRGGHVNNYLNSDGNGGSGSATNNTVSIKGGTFNSTTNIYGGHVNNKTGSATNNTVSIDGGTFNGTTNIYGGYLRYGSGSNTGDATNNTVYLSDGIFNSTVSLYGGYNEKETSASKVTTGNRLYISLIENFSGTAYNFETITFVDEGTYNLGVSTDGTFSDGSTTTTLAVGDKDVTLAGVISNGDITTHNITKTGSGTLTLSGNNTYTGSTTVKAGTLRLANADALSGSNGTYGSYTVNSGAILDFAFTDSGTVNNDISGKGDVTVNAASNDITVSFLGSYTNTGWTYVNTGILNASEAQSFSSSTLYIRGGATFAAPLATTYSPKTLIADASNGSSVNYKNSLVMAEGSSLKIYGPANVNSTALLLVEGDANLKGISYSYTPTSAVPLLQTGEKIYLIDATGELSTEGATGTYNLGTGTTITYGLIEEHLSTDGQLNLVVTSAEVAPQAESLLEGSMAASSLVNQGADLVAGSGIEAAVAATRAIREPGKIAFTPFATVQGASMRYNSGSHINMQSMNLLTGLAAGFDTAVGDLALGAFFEYGTGSYSTYNSFNTGSFDGAGDMYAVGWGILGRMDFEDMGPGHFYVEASGRMGGLYNTYENEDMRDYAGRSAEYDRYSAYYGFHAGLGYIFDFMEAAHLDVYGKYFWTRVDGEELTLSTGDELEFDAVTSSRLRFGTRFTYDVNEKVSPYIGFAYEHEFDARAGGKTYGYDISSTSLKGDTGMGEIGISLKPSELPLELDITVQGYVGKREGVMGTVFFKYTF